MNIEGDPATYGAWEPIQYKFHHLPVHTALLHTGKVLGFGGSGNDPQHLNDLYPAEIFEPNTIDDEAGLDHKGRVYAIPNDGIQGDIFCAGHAFLPDGRILVAGGTYKYDGSFFGIPIPPFSGLNHSYLFDPDNLKWTRIQDMRHGRWYPTSVMLSNGNILVMAGLQKNFPWAFLNKLEIYSRSVGWEELKGANRWLPLYPRLHLLPDGRVFYAGSFNTHYTFPFSVKGFPSALLDVGRRKWETIGNPNNVNREEGTTVLLPLEPPNYHAKIMLIAGGTPAGKHAIPDVELIDFSDPRPRYKPMQSLKHSRYYAYAVLLPDRTVLVLGGQRGKKGHVNQPYIQDGHLHNGEDIPHNPDAVLEPEMFNPNDERWYPMADMKVDRLYHSNALLLPDGRVMCAGSNPHRRVNELRIEMFRPPYLFHGGRPRITRFPQKINYGTAIEIETPQAGQIINIVLIRPSITTHCVNTEQRYVGLEFSQKNFSLLSAQIPSSCNVIPPGYYLLFIIKEGGIPSVATFVSLGQGQ